MKAGEGLERKEGREGGRAGKRAGQGAPDLMEHFCEHQFLKGTIRRKPGQAEIL